MMKEEMRNEWEIFYILKLAEGLCLLAIDLGGKTHYFKKLGKLEWCEEL